MKAILSINQLTAFIETNHVWNPFFFPQSCSSRHILRDECLCFDSHRKVGRQSAKTEIHLAFTDAAFLLYNPLEHSVSGAATFCVCACDICSLLIGLICNKMSCRQMAQYIFWCWFRASGGFTFKDIRDDAIRELISSFSLFCLSRNGWSISFWSFSRWRRFWKLLHTGYCVIPMRTCGMAGTCWISSLWW